tara:strand:- start:88 stop:384 length:297 start_codon:yes stop_codon:yes gene_type:complete
MTDQNLTDALETQGLEDQEDLRLVMERRNGPTTRLTLEELSMRPTTTFGLFTRLQFALLAVISPQRLVEAVTAGFLSAVDSMDDDELETLLTELDDAN